MASGKLTARKTETAKPGRYGDGAGLWLVVAPSGARKWAFRFTWRGKVSVLRRQALPSNGGGLTSRPAAFIAAPKRDRTNFFLNCKL